jgi:hypothetical protein
MLNSNRRIRKKRARRSIFGRDSDVRLEAQRVEALPRIEAKYAQGLGVGLSGCRSLRGSGRRAREVRPDVRSHTGAAG